MNTDHHRSTSPLGILNMTNTAIAKGPQMAADGRWTWVEAVYPLPGGRCVSALCGGTETSLEETREGMGWTARMIPPACSQV